MFKVTTQILMQKIQDKSFLYLEISDLVMEKDQTLEDVCEKDFDQYCVCRGILRTWRGRTVTAE